MRGVAGLRVALVTTVTATSANGCSDTAVIHAYWRPPLLPWALPSRADWEAEERAVKEAAARALDEARGAISSLGLDDQEAEELFGGDDDDDDDEGDGDGVDGEDDGDGDGPSEQGA